MQVRPQPLGDLLAAVRRRATPPRLGQAVSESAVADAIAARDTNSFWGPNARNPLQRLPEPIVCVTDAGDVVVLREHTDIGNTALEPLLRGKLFNTIQRGMSSDWTVDGSRLLAILSTASGPRLIGRIPACYTGDINLHHELPSEEGFSQRTGTWLTRNGIVFYVDSDCGYGITVNEHDTVITNFADGGFSGDWEPLVRIAPTRGLAGSSTLTRLAAASVTGQVAGLGYASTWYDLQIRLGTDGGLRLRYRPDSVAAQTNVRVIMLTPGGRLSTRPAAGVVQALAAIVAQPERAAGIAAEHGLYHCPRRDNGEAATDYIGVYVSEAGVIWIPNEHHGNHLAGLQLSPQHGSWRSEWTNSPRLGHGHTYEIYSLDIESQTARRYAQQHRGDHRPSVFGLTAAPEETDSGRYLRTAHRLAVTSGQYLAVSQGGWPVSINTITNDGRLLGHLYSFDHLGQLCVRSLGWQTDGSLADIPATTTNTAWIVDRLTVRRDLSRDYTDDMLHRLDEPMRPGLWRLRDGRLGMLISVLPAVLYYADDHYWHPTGGNNGPDLPIVRWQAIAGEASVSSRLGYLIRSFVSP